MPSNEDNAVGPAEEFAVLWRRFIQLAAGTGFEADRARKLLRLIALVIGGRVPESEVRLAVGAISSGREPAWPLEVLEAGHDEAQLTPAVSANRIARLERQLADAEAAFVGLGLPASESRVLAPYVRYTLHDWTPFVPDGWPDWPEHVLRVLGDRYFERTVPLPEPTAADVADALAEIENARGSLIGELVKYGLDSMTAQRFIEEAGPAAAQLAPALQRTAEQGHDPRLEREQPPWEYASTIGILVRTLAEPTPERVSGTEKYLRVSF
jgi:hypothetical protein